MSSATARVRWPAFAYAAIVLVACVFAFVQLGRSNYWADELFTVFVIGGDGGLHGLWQRALTDVHPPLYYVLLQGWSRLGDLSEAWLRLPSAVCAVLALLLTGRLLWRRFSPMAVGYALAVAAVSTFWFEQAQNARSYGLCILIAADLMGVGLWLREHVAARARFPLLAFAALVVLGLAGSFVHFYLLLLTGMVMAWLLAVPRLRLPVIAAGLAILAAVGGYTWLLWHATEQDVGHTWYHADLGFFWSQTRMANKHLATAASGWALTGLCVAAVWRRLRHGRGSLKARVPAGGSAVARLSLFVVAGMVVSGILVSCLLAPSYSARNLLTALPFICALLAWLYDAAGPVSPTRANRVMAALLVVAVGAQLWLLSGRFVQRNEPWRDTAAFVAAIPGCAGQVVPVMHPYKFGPPTPAFRQLAERDFFGHYAPPGMSIQSWMPGELTGRRPVPALAALLAERAAAAGSGACPLLAWAVHDLDDEGARLLAQDLARAPGIAPRRVVLQTFLRARRHTAGWRPTEDGFVFYVLPPAAPGVAAVDPGPLVDMPAGVLGERDVVTLLDPPTQTPRGVLDHFLVQAWSDGHLLRSQSVAARRVTCTGPLRADDDIRPAPDSPACTGDAAR